MKYCSRPFCAGVTAGLVVVAACLATFGYMAHCIEQHREAAWICDLVDDVVCDICTRPPVNCSWTPCTATETDKYCPARCARERDDLDVCPSLTGAVVTLVVSGVLAVLVALVLLKKALCRAAEDLAETTPPPSPRPARAAL